MILRMLMSFLGEENFLNGIKVAFARQIDGIYFKKCCNPSAETKQLGSI